MLGNYKFYCNCKAIFILAFSLLLFLSPTLFANAEYTGKLWKYLESTWKDVPDSVERYLYYNADVNAEHDPGKLAGFTPLLFAAKKGYVNIAETLIDNGADVDAVDFNGKSALMYAAENGDVGLIRLLLKADADIRLPDFEDQNALHFAVRQGNAKAVSVLLQFNAPVNKRDKYGRSVLMKACGRGANTIVTVLLNYGANFYYMDENGETAMIYAIRADAVHVVQTLIQRGFDIHKENVYGSTYLAPTMMMDRPEISKILLDNGANPNTVFTLEPFQELPVLIYVISNKQYELVNLLLDKKADVNKQHPSGWTALMTAVMIGDSKLVETLCDRGAHVDAFILADESKGQTALISAVLHDHYVTAKYLAARSKKINHQDASGYTALDYALAKGNIEIVQILINKGAESSADTYTLAERQ